MDRLFLESAGGRRRFLDRLVLGFDPEPCPRPSHAYEHAMRERARLLGAAIATGLVHGAGRTMARQGVALAAARPSSGLIGLDGPNAAEAVGPFPRPPPWPERSTAGCQMPALREDRLRDDAGGRAPARRGSGHGLWRVRTAAISRCATPPRIMPARDCSTGEQKALLAYGADSIKVLRRRGPRCRAQAPRHVYRRHR
jgi:DNA replication and repair protein RecF